MCPLFQSSSLVDSIYRGLVFVSIQPVFAFCLGHSTHLYLKVIVYKYDPFAIYFIVLGLSFYTLYVFLSRQDPLAFVGELVWWYRILSAFARL